MPSASAIVLADSTPANHTFTPRNKVGPELTILSNGESSTSAGAMNLQLGYDAAKPNRKTNRVSIRFNYPVEHTVDGVVRVAYTARFVGDIILPEEMTAAERGHLAAYIQNMFANSVIKGYVSTLDPMY